MRGMGSVSQSSSVGLPRMRPWPDHRRARVRVGLTLSIPPLGQKPKWSLTSNDFYANLAFLLSTPQSRSGVAYGRTHKETDMPEQIILVDRDDRPIGVQEKLDAHQAGNLHRAFSVYVFNAQQELLIQKRAEVKYHSGGAWTNTCDGHPRAGEQTEDAAHRRLREEMGFDCPLTEAFHFIYHAELDRGLVEHEFCYAYVGECHVDPKPDPAEVDEWKWIGLPALQRDMQQHPERYAPWFKIPFDKLLAYVRQT